MEKYLDEDSLRQSRESISGDEEGARLIESNSTSTSSVDDPVQPAKQRKHAPYSRLIFVLLLLSNSLLLAATTALLVSRPRSQQPRERQPPAAWLPPEKLRDEVFRFQPKFGEEISPEIEEDWRRLIPRGKGFVFINNETILPEMPGLDQSLPQQRAMISVFHELHCLYVSRLGYFSAKAGNLDDVNTNHLTHCWDYLRQAIMCHGDTTLEWLAAPPNDEGSTGWGYRHQCRDYNAIFDWAEQNRVTDKQVIIH